MSTAHKYKEHNEKSQKSTIKPIHIEVSHTADWASISSIDLRACEFDDTVEGEATFSKVDIDLTNLPQFPIWATVHEQRSPH